MNFTKTDFYCLLAAIFLIGVVVGLAIGSSFIPTL